MVKKTVKRKRGTTSVRCPKCKASSRVLRTYPDPQGIGITHRERICARNHRFTTSETPEIS